jgi:hypothetical protein
MRSACSRLDQNCFQIRKVADREYHSSWVPTVLGHAAGHVTAVSDDILAKLGLPAGAVEAIETWL